MKKTVSHPALCDRRPKTPRMKEFIRSLDKYGSVVDFATDLEKRAYRGKDKLPREVKNVCFHGNRCPFYPNCRDVHLTSEMKKTSNSTEVIDCLGGFVASAIKTSKRCEASNEHVVRHLDARAGITTLDDEELGFMDRQTRFTRVNMRYRYGRGGTRMPELREELPLPTIYVGCDLPEKVVLPKI